MEQGMGEKSNGLSRGRKVARALGFVATSLVALCACDVHAYSLAKDVPVLVFTAPAAEALKSAKDRLAGLRTKYSGPELAALEKDIDKLDSGAFVVPIWTLVLSPLVFALYAVCSCLGDKGRAAGSAPEGRKEATRQLGMLLEAMKYMVDRANRGDPNSRVMLRFDEVCGIICANLKQEGAPPRHTQKQPEETVEGHGSRKASDSR
jgi:hypothetical protein